jgi:hypothetical protein
VANENLKDESGGPKDFNSEDLMKIAAEEPRAPIVQITKHGRTA